MQLSSDRQSNNQKSWLKAVLRTTLVIIIALANTLQIHVARADSPYPAPQLLGEYESYVLPVQMGDSAYYLVEEGSQSTLWRTQGTPQTTEQIFEFPDGNTPGVDLFVYKDRLYMSVNTGSGYQIYTSDGTTGGSGLFMDVQGRYFSTYKDWMIFWIISTDSFQLWRSDGTPEGTSQVKVISGSFLRYKTWVYDDWLTFWMQDGNSVELWKSDGSVQGTMFVQRFEQNNVANLYYYPYAFSIDTSGNHVIWFTDLAANSLTPLIQFNSPTDLYSFHPSFAQSSSGLTTIFIYEYIDANNDTLEIWQTDNTPENTVKNVSFSNRGGSYLEQLDGMAYFILSNESPYEDTYSLWQTDGTASGTINVDESLRFIDYDYGCVFDGYYYFFERPSLDDYFYIYRIGGQDNPGLQQIHVYKNGDKEMAAYKGKLYYTDVVGGHGTLFYINGDTATSIGQPAAEFGLVYDLYSSQTGYLLFWDMDLDYHARFYISDGTAAGTALLFTQFPVDDDDVYLERVLETPTAIYYETGTAGDALNRLSAVYFGGPAEQTTVFLPAIFH